ncbi:hypothetical protein LQV63_27535 [Paenibacillus profundus]|uniref:Uncharacterized protein n=1 Tax=Paenibacillus profundus TaxID=1173085 RepID=A0ABS8YQW8_9BACL|nr:hypothetical protein [Paenibacillus profundus]MCE5173020.1 hypothetical protein [Paenibacillus profundus]
MAVSKDRINYLITRLSNKDLELITDLMERLIQHNQTEIPIDDEPTTQDDLNAIQAAHEAMCKGELVALKDIEHELRN